MSVIAFKISLRSETKKNQKATVKPSCSLLGAFLSNQLLSTQNNGDSKSRYTCGKYIVFEQIKKKNCANQNGTRRCVWFSFKLTSFDWERCHDDLSISKCQPDNFYSKVQSGHIYHWSDVERFVKCFWVLPCKQLKKLGKILHPVRLGFLAT